MSQSPFVVSGATGGAPNRLEINDFVKNDKYFSLYIQALQAMQTENQGQTPSYFQVAGIHGLPYVPWNGVQGSKPWDPNTTAGGYCTHGSVLFPTWHRPYIMLYEQIIQQHALKIAATYTVDKPAWNAAASQLRQPFWDWAANAVPPDEVIALTQVTITAPDGKRIKVDNPLYHYTFHPIDSSFRSPQNQWKTTLRQPTLRQPLSSMTDNVPRLRRVLQAAQGDITSSTYNMLTRVDDWVAFSNHTAGDGGSTSNSVEAIHDGIHVNIGGRGHMSQPPVASFDPIFFLHHCNVDRMLSLWSALHPGVWVTSSNSEDGTFTIPADTAVNDATPLTPFWNGQTTFWTSSGTGDTSRLGYTYPDFNGLDMGNRQTVMNAIAKRVNDLYGSSVFGAAAASTSPPAPSPAPKSVEGTKAPPASGSPPPTAAPSAEKQLPFGLHAGSPSSLGRQVAESVTSNITQMVEKHSHLVPHVGGAQGTAASSVQQVAQAVSSSISQFATQHGLHGHAQQGHDQQQQQGEHGHHDPSILAHALGHLHISLHHPIYDWTARIEFKKFELSSSFSVLLFLGQVPENPDDWQVSENYVGGHHAFVNSAAAQCANCARQANVIGEGFVHLNEAILKHSGLNSLEPSVVEPYLKQNLHWRVQKTDGEVATLSSLEVSVFGTPLSYPPGALFAARGLRRRFNQITHGRHGGSREAEVTSGH